MSNTDVYVSPLSERYASKEMQFIFSPDMKFRTWRRLWIALAETEKELGLNITQEQIEELEENIFLVDFHAQKGNYSQMLELDNRFHDILYEASKSRMLKQELSNFHLQNQNLMQT